MPTDLADIRYRARAQREFAVVVAHATFTLRRPYAYDVALAEGRARDAGSPGAALVVLERELLLKAVVGWQAVTVGDIIDNAPEPAELLPYQADSVELLLNARPEWGEQLSSALFERMAAAKDKQDSAEKN